jgi:hypothetical protein
MTELDRILSLAPIDLDKLYSGPIREALHELQVFRSRELYVSALIESVLGVLFEGSDEPMKPPPEDVEDSARSVIYCNNELTERWFPEGHEDRCSKSTPTLAEWERKA